MATQCACYRIACEHIQPTTPTEVRELFAAFDDVDFDFVQQITKEELASAVAIADKVYGRVVPETEEFSPDTSVAMPDDFVEWFMGECSKTDETESPVVMPDEIKEWFGEVAGDVEDVATAEAERWFVEERVPILKYMSFEEILEQLYKGVSDSSDCGYLFAPLESSPDALLASGSRRRRKRAEYAEVVPLAPRQRKPHRYSCYEYE